MMFASLIGIFVTSFLTFAQCDPTLMCGEAITCCDGTLYPTTCCAENCDEPVGSCSSEECTDGEVNNENPCNSMECWDGQWIELIIDCAEQMGIPCEGGGYVPPPPGECCSTCVGLGDLNQDGSVNVADVVALVSEILSDDPPSTVSDLNGDGVVNVSDVVALVSLIFQ